MRGSLFAMLGTVVLLAGCLTHGPPVTPPSDDTGRADWQPTWAEVEAAHLRPGSRMDQLRSLAEDDGVPCTLNFLFVDPVAELYYVGAAGHCTDGVESPDDGMGQRVTLSGVREIGTVVFDSDSLELQSEFAVERAVDFSLIQLDVNMNMIAHPQVIGLEAPTGLILCAATALGDLFAYHGHGLPFGEVEQTRTRHGILSSCDGRNHAGEAVGSFGDSGAPVVHTASGAALGIIVGVGVDVSPPAPLAGTTISFVFSELAKAGFVNLALATMDGGYVNPDH